MAEKTTEDKDQDVQEEEKKESAEKDEQPDALDPELAVPRGTEVIACLEALLFATTTPLTVKKLSVLMNGVPEEEVTEGLETLKEKYNQPTSGLTLMEVAGGWQVATSADVADWVLRLHKHRKKSGISPSLMETLAIVAYKQPLTRAEIEQIRGVDCGAAIRALQDAGLAEVVGRREVAGRPPLYGTTKLFLKTFGLSNLESLPSVGQLKSILNAPMKRPEEEEAKEDAEKNEEPPAPKADGENEATQEAAESSEEQPTEEEPKNDSAD